MQICGVFVLVVVIVLVLFVVIVLFIFIVFVVVIVLVVVIVIVIVFVVVIVLVVVLVIVIVLIVVIVIVIVMVIVVVIVIVLVVVILIFIGPYVLWTGYEYFHEQQRILYSTLHVGNIGVNLKRESVTALSNQELCPRKASGDIERCFAPKLDHYNLSFLGKLSASCN